MLAEATATAASCATLSAASAQETAQASTTPLISSSHQRLNRINGRKAIVLFTDGVDTTSRRATYQTNIHDAEEFDALIYPVPVRYFLGYEWVILVTEHSTDARSTK